VAAVELRFGVMASAVQVILVDPARGAEDYARARLEELERRWSRFLPASDVTRLNTSPEAMIIVSPDTMALLATMKEGHRASGGRFDPTMLAAINAAGYATSITGTRRRSRMADLPWRALTIHDVSLDLSTSSATVPGGVGIDPGGVGKGLAADMLVTELLARGTGGALVSIGGDLAAAGRCPTPEGWYVDVADPFDRRGVLRTLAFGGGGIATSSTLSRTWTKDGRRRHHVIDPDTRTCSITDLAAVTVVARAGWEAEVHATAALLSGWEGALAYLDRRSLAGLATTRDGMTSASAALDAGGVVQRSVT
jgi:thiamine biosynthesis lipoprotein